MGEPPDGGEPVQASWPDLTCYGCGPANDVGLHLESYVGEDGGTLVAPVFTLGEAEDAVLDE